MLFPEIIVVGFPSNSGTIFDIHACCVQLYPLSRSFKIVVETGQTSCSTIISGNSIDFTDLSTGSPTTWDWTFYGAETTSSSDQHPSNIIYNTSGVYDVRLIISDGVDIEIILKEDYITVIDTSQMPVANFTSNFTTILVGNDVDFYDLTSNNPDSWLWDFTGANITSSTDQNPTNISYNTVGLYPVTLNQVPDMP